ncbi:unnamed protein product [Brassicogethes aeneus]|uniref:RNA-binding protein 26 n=1 Tax=Brassicogethes aeneus TaxID=1431903 RepID=A0A9P0AU71_BRAAE|nr:unnamed protein product [Brassicogethes aeneus]
MIVDQVEAFKTWLTAVLKPMCEADPAALAKYVLALIKKDKSEEELRKSMIGQLDVFLEGETENFVKLVFQTLETKDYINTPVIPNANPPNPNLTKPLVKDNKEIKVIVPPNDLPNLSEAVNGSGIKKDVVEVKKDHNLKPKTESDKEEKPVRRRSRHRSLSRNRSRSRSWDRTKRSRSREKSRDRDQYRVDREKRDRPRVWRNKSPPRRYDRRRSRTPSPSRLRSRSRSPRHSHRARYRRGSGSRSRSRSAEKRERRDSAKDGAKEHGSRPGTPTQDSNHGDMDLRLTNSTQSIASVVVAQNNKRRCRDFDEKGYCMRGEMCPFDHGMDPVVLEDAALRVLTYNPNGGPMTADGPGALPPAVMPPVAGLMGPRGPQPEYNPQAPQMWNRGGFRGGPRAMGPTRLPPPPGAFVPPGGMQRELISVPVMDNKQGDQPMEMQYPGPFNHQGGGYINHHHHHHDGGPYKKKAFDFNRLGPRGKNPSNCSLELKKVPPGLNSITHLNNHFGKFGKIVNIQVQYEGDPEAALVTFSSHAEANAAYRSTEAVLNNRFIKVFWHQHNPLTLEGGKQENVPPTMQRSNVKDRLGQGGIVPPNVNKVLNLVQPKADEDIKEQTEEEKEGAEKEAAINKEETKAQQTAAIKKNQELLAATQKLKKNQEDQRKDMLKIKNDLRKRKQDLLEKQLMQQRKLIEKMEKLPAGPQRDLIKDTIKKSQESIETIKKDLEQAAQAAKLHPAKRSKEDVQKELLDMELDLIAKQQEGQDTVELQKKLQELRTRASLRGGTARGRGRGRYVPVSRHLLSKNNLIADNNKVKTGGVTKPSQAAKLPFQKHTLDHRPTRLLVSGYEIEEQDSVLGHFQQYGEIVDYVTDNALPSITLNYKTRKEAEMALLKGKNFQDRTLSITWSQAMPMQRATRSTSRTVLMSESEEDQLMDQSLLDGDEELGPEISEEALLQDDEEEDEENEDRSWRR